MVTVNPERIILLKKSCYISEISEISNNEEEWGSWCCLLFKMYFQVYSCG
jgi:hypothetical protein